MFKDTSLPPCETELSRTPLFQKNGLTLLLPVPMGGPGDSSHVTLNVTSDGVPPDFLPPPSVSGPMYDLLPQFAAPEGDTLRSRFESAGQVAIMGSATVTTNLSPAQLAEHFAAQLTAAGWRVTERRSSERSAVVRLERRKGDKPYRAQLSVARPEGQTYSNVDFEAALRTDE